MADVEPQSMSNSSRKIALALVLLLSLPQARAFDVHGIRIGDRWNAAGLEQAMSYPSVPILQRVKCRTDGEEACVGTTRFLVADVRLIVEGKNGRVSKMTMTLPTEEFEDEITALKHEFGAPTDEWSAPPDATAPLLFRHRVDWRQPTQELFALKFSTMATIRLTTPEDSAASRFPPPPS
jgi:hypothetical protein